MDIGSIIFWAAVVGLVLYLISIYNHLVRLKHNVSKAWSNIDVLLKQRHDEIPKLVETCKQYMKFEQETLEKVMTKHRVMRHPDLEALLDTDRWARIRAQEIIQKDAK